VGKTVTKYRNRDRDYGEDEYRTKAKRNNQEPKRQRKIKYEEILEQYEDENNFHYDEDGLAT
jgi:hypothetical protein